jgi:superfamily I DNA and RNA helicase
LATAHALGIGVYRSGGLLQHPDEPRLWRDIGYNVVHGELAPGKRVTLERSRESYPDYFRDRLEPSDAVVIESFPDEHEQDLWVAAQIAVNLESDELEHDDILVVLPDSYRAKSRAPRLIRELARKGIQSHLVGVNTSVDEVFQPGSVAIAHIFRAKGNEAPMVYAIDSQYAASDFNLVTRRNTLFTAITRSRAWVRITGWGEQMQTICEEANKVVNMAFKLEFPIPTADELAVMRHIHRERSENEEASMRRAAEGLTTFLDAVERGDIDVSDLPPALRTKLIMSVRTDVSGDDS